MDGTLVEEEESELSVQLKVPLMLCQIGSSKMALELDSGIEICRSPAQLMELQCLG